MTPRGTEAGLAGEQRPRWTSSWRGRQRDIRSVHKVSLKEKCALPPDLFLPAGRNVVVMAGAQGVILDHEVKV